jgi:hypothetical protein
VRNTGLIANACGKASGTTATPWAAEVVKESRLIPAGLTVLALLASPAFSESEAVRVGPKELATEDFRFNGIYGSDGAQISRLSTNHFRVTLQAGPGHKNWPNVLQFEITANAKGNGLRLDVVFPGSMEYPFNEYFTSFSYDRKRWTAVPWKRGGRKSAPSEDVLVFPVFAEDRIFVAHQNGFAHEDLMDRVAAWEKHPDVRVETLGNSLENRPILRFRITKGDAPAPLRDRWCHYLANQHAAECNARYRMAGLLDWLLSDEGLDARSRAVWHLVLLSNPDGSAHGWRRQNGQGVDMNRSYRANGSDAKAQAHEAYILQADLERLMKGECPPVTVFGMHTWLGKIVMFFYPGPEVGVRVGPWTDLRDTLSRLDTRGLFKPLAMNVKEGPTTYWTYGPKSQFKISAFLVEGGGDLFSQDDNALTGEVLGRAISAYYKGLRR